jgi:betaine-aldehyde dehydrogenase
MPLLDLPSLPPLDIYYGGAWHKPKSGERKWTDNPGNGSDIAEVAFGGEADAVAALEAAQKAFPGWKATAPTERARLLRKAASIILDHAQELALLDTLDTGNPVSEMLGDARMAAANIEYFAGLYVRPAVSRVPG